MLTPEFLAVVPQFLSTYTETCVRGLEGLLWLCFSRDLSAEELHLMLGDNVSVPPYVRQGLFSRRSAVEEHRSSIPHVRVQLLADAGHAVFWDDAARFNERLHAFNEAL